MITNYKEYREYVRCDLAAYQVEHLTLFRYFFDDCLRFQLRLRRIEWLHNAYSTASPHARKGSLIAYLLRGWCGVLQIINHRLATRLGLSIPKNVFGPGLCIVHYGTIVVSPKARIGRNCRIHPSTSIGDYNGAPAIGDNVYIGPGAKLFGDITIGNNVAVGANAVVNHSFGDDVTIGGIPATIISHRSSLETGVFPDTLIQPLCQR